MDKIRWQKEHEKAEWLKMAEAKGTWEISEDERGYERRPEDTWGTWRYKKIAEDTIECQRILGKHGDISRCQRLQKEDIGYQKLPNNPRKELVMDKESSEIIQDVTDNKNQTRGCVHRPPLSRSHSWRLGHLLWSRTACFHAMAEASPLINSV